MKPKALPYTKIPPYLAAVRYKTIFHGMGVNAPTTTVWMDKVGRPVLVTGAKASLDFLPYAIGRTPCVGMVKQCTCPDCSAMRASHARR